MIWTGSRICAFITGIPHTVEVFDLFVPLDMSGIVGSIFTLVTGEGSDRLDARVRRY